MPDQTLAQRVKAKYPGEYDDIPDVELETKIKTKYPGQYDDLPMTQAQETAKSKDNSGGFISSLMESSGLAHPLDTVTAMGKALLDPYSVLTSERDRLKNLATTTRPHSALEWVPLVGPALGKAADQAAEGNYTGAAGTVTGVVAPGMIGKLKPGMRVGAAFENPNLAERAAVAFGEREGIPVDAGTATGNPVVRGVQQLTDKGTIGGGIIGRQAVKAQEAALTSTGERLANRVNPSPVTNIEAGQAVTQAFTDTVSKLHQEAGQAYGDLRAIENDPKNLKQVTTGTKTENTGVLDAQGKPISRTVPITEDIALPVDLRAAKQALQPVLDRMKRQVPVTQQQASAGLRALENLVTGPDFASASTVDADLSSIKSIAREASSPDLRNRSQGLAAQSVTNLEKAVQAAVARGGPKALVALQKGRAATAQKYAVADTLSSLNDEPGRVYTQVLGTKDSNLARLREINRVAPQVMPKLGRAYLEDLLTTATAEGGFDRAQGLWSKWQNLGPGTKSLIFKNPALVSDLNNFFLLAKKMATNPNPSGTSYVASIGAQGGMLLWQPHIAVPVELGTAALSKLLHSRAGVKALTEGMRVSVGNKTAAALASANILRLAEEQQDQQVPEPVPDNTIAGGIR